MFNRDVRTRFAKDLSPSRVVLVAGKQEWGESQLKFLARGFTPLLH